MLAGVHHTHLCACMLGAYAYECVDIFAPYKHASVYAFAQPKLHHHQCIRVGLDYASGREAEDHWKPVTKLDQAVRLASKPSTGKTQYDCSV